MADADTTTAIDEAETAPEAVTLTDWQARVALIPEEHGVALLGGRGCGKSWAIAWLILRHVEQHGDRARVLFLRKTYAGLRDFEGVLRELFGHAYGTRASYNGAEHVWKTPSGGYVELGQLETRSDYPKYQGRSFTMLCIDEAAQYPDPSLLDLLRSNLRSRRGVPIRVIIAANPGGVGHSWLSRRHALNGSAPWVPYTDATTGASWVTCPGTFIDNPTIDAEDYRRQLAAACAADPELLKAWTLGDWSACVGGSFFGDVIAEHRVAIDPAGWTGEWLSRQGSTAGRALYTMQAVRDAAALAAAERWDTYLSMDYGSAAPACCFVVVRSPGAEGPDGRYYPRGSVLLLDELYSCDPDHPEQGLRWTVPTLADHIISMAQRWGIDPRCSPHVLDDACFSQHGSAAGSIAEELLRAGVRFLPARKGSRAAGWQTMRTMLQAAGSPDVPGLYVSRRCEHWWRTTPYLARDPRRPDDLDTRAEDHAADACRYALGERPTGLTSGHNSSLWPRRS